MAICCAAVSAQDYCQMDCPTDSESVCGQYDNGYKELFSSMCALEVYNCMHKSGKIKSVIIYFILSSLLYFCLILNYRSSYQGFWTMFSGLMRNLSTEHPWANILQCATKIVQYCYSYKLFRTSSTSYNNSANFLEIALQIFTKKLKT